MESQRTFLLIGLIFVSILLYQQWQLDYGPQSIQNEPITTTNVPVVDSDQPEFTSTTSIAVSTTAAHTPTTTQQVDPIFVITPLLRITIDPKGGDITHAELTQYPVVQNEPALITLLKKETHETNVAQSGLIGPDGPDSNKAGRPLYQVEKNEYFVDGDQAVTVPLRFQNTAGLTVIKQFTFYPDRYEIGLTYEIDNASDRTQTLQSYHQLKQTMITETGSMMMPTYQGGAYSTQDEVYEKYSFDDMTDNNLKLNTEGGWIAMIQHYFIVSWVPGAADKHQFYSRIVNDDQAILGEKGPAISLAAHSQTELKSTLYVGPKVQDKLEAISDNLDLAVDYGPLWWLSQPLFLFLKFLQDWVHNWGVAIILITIFVKMVMYPLTKAQYTSMAKLRNLQPKMNNLKERFGDDRQKMGQAMMELYRKEKVNPMGGCLPMIIQMPIFLALYWMFLESVELRHAPFMLWITDLSSMDPYFVLPVLYGASMFLMQRLQPHTVTDPMQQKIMMWMPVFFSVLFLWFPSGLVLYWLVNNLISIIQMLMVYKSMEKTGLMKKT